MDNDETNDLNDDVRIVEDEHESNSDLEMTEEDLKAQTVFSHCSTIKYETIKRKHEFS